jgi:predicted phosphodiesterase
MTASVPCPRCNSFKAVDRACKRCESIQDHDLQLLSQNVRLAKQRQGLQDINRIERKSFREYARIENAVTNYTGELVKLLKESSFTSIQDRTPVAVSDNVVIVQLSDLHFNEQVELPSNQYNFDVASKRLAKLAERVIQVGSAHSAGKVVIACLGDFLNSDRRLDELLSNATNRAKATLVAVDILKSFILHLSRHFDVEICAITGNEGRAGKELGWSEKLATDNYDYTIYQVLKLVLGDSQGIDFKGFEANELVFEVHGKNFLCIHGHQVGQATQKTMQEISGRYANQGVTIDYILFGHIHASYIGDYHARNASLVGANAYSESGLMFSSKAAQNIHLVSASGIDSMKIDLQDVSAVEGYEFNQEWKEGAASRVVKQNKALVSFRVEA